MSDRQESNTARVIVLAAFVVAGGLAIGLLLSLLVHMRSGSELSPQSSTSTAVSGVRGRSQVATGDSSVRVAGAPVIAPWSAVASDSTVLGERSTSPSAAVSSAIAVASPGSRMNRARATAYVFECDSAFRADDTLDELRQRYGAENVISQRIAIGEGFFEPGAILFADDSLRRVEVAWQDTTRMRNPRMVWVRGNESERSTWQTRDAITIGTDLLAIERLNGRPFTLTGFGWDYGGTVMSWQEGRLQHYVSPSCEVRMRLSPHAISDAAMQRMRQQVTGSGDFPSNHRAMQALNPRVRELFLQFKQE